MTDRTVEDVIKSIVTANFDGEVKAIAVVFVNAEGEPELEIGVNHENAYKIITGLEILKLNIIGMMLDKAAKPPKDRS